MTLSLPYLPIQFDLYSVLGYSPALCFFPGCYCSVILPLPFLFLSLATPLVSPISLIFSFFPKTPISHPSLAPRPGSPTLFIWAQSHYNEGTCAHSLFMHASDFGHVGWSYNLAILSRTKINTNVKISLWYVYMESFGYLLFTWPETARVQVERKMNEQISVICWHGIL